MSAPTARPAVRRRWSLATRISLLSVAIAAITVLIAGTLATGLIRSNGVDSARQTLGRLADVAQSVSANRQTGAIAKRRLTRALQGLDVRSGVVEADGRLVTSVPLVTAAITSDDVTALLAGHDVSASRRVDGGTVFVEGRAAGVGGIVLVQRRTDAVAQDERAIRRFVLALVVAGGLAAVIGLLVARRLARPLRRTAAAAHALAAGHRDVTLPAEGPTEVVAVSEAVNRIAGALRHSEARQREFLLSVSHDLRTPLTAIRGYSESLAESVVPPADVAHVGGVMLAEAGRLERMVGDLLDLARLGAADLRLEPTVNDLAALAREAAGVWSTRCAAGGVPFALQSAETPLPVLTDAARLRQALDGLLENALRVTPPGAPIVLAVRAEPGAAVVEVRDGGPGLAEDDLAVAFQQGVLHRRYRGVREVGTGLGLAIVHGLVTRLGGTIEAGHAAEGGARFTVRLPPAPPSPAAPPMPPAA